MKRLLFLQAEARINFVSFMRGLKPPLPSE